MISPQDINLEGLDKELYEKYELPLTMGQIPIIKQYLADLFNKIQGEIEEKKAKCNHFKEPYVLITDINQIIQNNIEVKKR